MEICSDKHQVEWTIPLPPAHPNVLHTWVRTPNSPSTVKSVRTCLHSRVHQSVQLKPFVCSTSLPLWVKTANLWILVLEHHLHIYIYICKHLKTACTNTSLYHYKGQFQLELSYRFPERYTALEVFEDLFMDGFWATWSFSMCP